MWRLHTDVQQPGQAHAGEDDLLEATPTSIVVDEHFVLRVPSGLDLQGTAPLLCAGITTYSPLRHWKVGKGQKVGIVGLGGLGHMGLKFAHAFVRAETVLFHHFRGQDRRRETAWARTKW